MPIPFIFNSDNTLKYKKIQRMRLPKALFLLLRINDAACYISFLKSFEQKLGLKDRNPQIVPAFP